MTGVLQDPANVAGIAAPAASQSAPARPDLLDFLKAEYRAGVREFTVKGFPVPLFVHPPTFPQLVALDGDAGEDGNTRAVLTLIRCLRYGDGAPVFQDNMQTRLALLNEVQGVGFVDLLNHVNTLTSEVEAKNV